MKVAILGMIKYSGGLGGFIEACPTKHLQRLRGGKCVLPGGEDLLAGSTNKANLLLN